MHVANPAIADGRSRAFISWPSSVLGPRPGIKETNLVAWGLFIGLIILPNLYRFWRNYETHAGSLPAISSGFTYFYGIGTIADKYPAERLYDYNLQQKIFNQISPENKDSFGPSPYPPFVGLFFSLLARLPFNLAYLIWLLISLGLYIEGILLISKLVLPQEGYRRSLVVCLALAFYPFLFDTLLNGRIAAIEVFSVGVAISQERRSNLFRSGLALSLLTYKPTLCLLLLPMLLITKRFKALSGFITGSAIFFAVTGAIAGFKIWPEYLRFLISFGRFNWLQPHTVLQYSRYIDFKSFLYSIPGGKSTTGLIILAAFTIAIFGVLAALLWKSEFGDRSEQYMAWAATLTWTMICNVYVPIYDSVLVVIALVLTIGALKYRKWYLAANWIRVLSILILAGARVSEELAVTYRIQILGTLIAVLGIAQLIFLRGTIRPKPIPDGTDVVAT